MDDALGGGERPLAVSEDELPVCSWGTPRDLSTWDSPKVAEIAWSQRQAELEVVARGAAAPRAAVQELLALQASDWAFLTSKQTAGDYPQRRLAGHHAALQAAIAADRAAESQPPSQARGLAPFCSTAPLLAG